MRILVLIVFGLFLTACQGTNPYGLTTASVGDPVVSSASGQAGTGGCAAGGGGRGSVGAQAL